MKKVYVIDTNVLLHDPQALFRFEENDLVIPMTVIEEVDRFKKDLSEIGRNARLVVQENLGSIERTVDMIVERLKHEEFYVAPSVRR